ncbi:MAG: hypothetical protein GF411_06350 [Candidatus Lokiarchaeota archaeon]|nr:hypothetical protein [Candidatus Lokiarchaeota archaeon]
MFQMRYCYRELNWTSRLLMRRVEILRNPKAMTEELPLGFAEEILKKKREVSFLSFVKQLTIDSQYGPKLFIECMADFQKEAFETLAPTYHAIRDGDQKPPIRKFWIERTKKSSKDADLAMGVVWLIAFAKRPLLIQVVAANKQQSGILLDRITALVHFNPWINEYIEIIRYGIRSRSVAGAECRIEATDDRGGAHGYTPSLLILNELTHNVSKWKAFEDHMHNFRGMAWGTVIISTNAGIEGTEAHNWKLHAITNPEEWCLLELNEPAPWISEENLKEARAMDPYGKEFARLWKGKWITKVGEATTQEEIDACFTEAGPTLYTEDNWLYVGAFDLGVSQDHAGVVAVGVNRQNYEVKLVDFAAIVPDLDVNGKHEVDISAVERLCLEYAERYNVYYFTYDPHAGGSFLAQRLRKHGLPMVETCFNSTKVQTEMAQTFIKLVKDGRLKCFDNEENRIKKDFSKFEIDVIPPRNYRLKAARDSQGHADVGFALVMSLPWCLRIMETHNIGLRPEDSVAWDSVGDLTQEEIMNMHPEMREIYNLYANDYDTW